MQTKIKTVLVLISIMVLLPASSLQAQWSEYGAPVCRASNTQTGVAIATDGAGGAIIAWEDRREGTQSIYVQRIDSRGYPLWVFDGVDLCPAFDSQYNPKITSDGSGGAIIVWQDDRAGHYDLFAQRIDYNGNILWSTDGVQICFRSLGQDEHQILADGSGGAIIAWRNQSTVSNEDIYAQHINSSGTLLWVDGGVSVCDIEPDQSHPEVTLDGSGGFIFVWEDIRTGISYDLYAQRLSSAGSRLWAVDGVIVCNATENQSDQKIVSDGSGGAYITWVDYRNLDYDIYAQRIDYTGASQWAANGSLVCGSSGVQTHPSLVSIGGGGVIITWDDNRGAGYDIYAQRVSPGGFVQWSNGGIVICNVVQNEYFPKIISDGAGGGIITWQDLRNGPYDIFSQRVDMYGTVLWSSDGVPVTTASANQSDHVVVSDGAGGVIVAWEDGRSGLYDDVFAQHLDSDGYWGFPSPDLRSVLDVPQDQGGKINLTWEASDYDADGGIVSYSIWRALSVPAAARLEKEGALLLTEGAVVPQIGDVPVLRMSLLAGVSFYWELIDSHDAYRIPQYSKIVDTSFDSTAASNDYHYFQIMAHTTDPAIFWTSDPDSGYSVDNISPAIPLFLVGEQLYSPEGLQLTWEENTEQDLGGYMIYRGLSAEFTPGPGNLVASVYEAEYLDENWDWAPGYWYKVSARDIHDNQSGYALLGPSELTGDDPVPVLKDFLGQNYPNPFNPSTTISFGLKEPGHVSLRIYNAAGCLVRVLVDESRPASVYKEAWDGMNSGGSRVSSGVYFYWIEAGEFSETRKMILLR